MAITDRNLPVGTRLVANFKKTRFICTVESGEEGGTIFALEDGKRFKSPSAAGSAVMGGTACNGWRFWSVEGEEQVTKETKPAAARTLKSKRGAKPQRSSRRTTKLITVMADQAGATEGMTRWWCNACMDAFEVFAGEKPTQCPEGHRIDDPELTAPAGIGAGDEAQVVA